MIEVEIPHAKLHKAGRPSCLIFGTCITRAFAYLLTQHSDFCRQYNLHSFSTDGGNQSLSEIGIPPELISTADVVIHHSEEWTDWGNERANKELISHISPNAKQISIPYPTFSAFWPFYCSDNRSCVENRYLSPMGKQISYPYGDSYVIKLLKSGMSAQEVVSHYTARDIADMVDLQKLFERNLEIIRGKDRHTHVRFANFLEEHFQSRKLFRTINHISNESSLFIVNHILNELGLTQLPRRLLDRHSEMIMHEVPIHPSIIKFFDLKFVDTKMRYQVDYWSRFTFEEYIYRYASYT